MYRQWGWYSRVSLPSTRDTRAIIECVACQVLRINIKQTKQESKTHVRQRTLVQGMPGPESTVLSELGCVVLVALNRCTEA